MRVIWALLLLFVANQGLATVLGRQVQSLVGKKLTKSSVAIINKINEVDENGRNALHHAVMLGDLSLVVFFITNGADTRATDNDGLIPLRYAERIAAEQPTVERMKIVSLVLEKTRGVNEGDEQGWPPMVWSLMAGDYERVIELRDRGANVFVGRGKLPGRHNPVWAAEHLQDDRAIKILAEQAPDRYFPVAVNHGYQNFVQAMIARGVDINVKDYQGYSAALRAAMAGRVNDLQMLIDNGAEIDSRVLFYAIYSGNPKLVKTIIDYSDELARNLVNEIALGQLIGESPYQTRGHYKVQITDVLKKLDETKGGRKIIQMLDSKTAPFFNASKLVKLVQGHVAGQHSELAGLDEIIKSLLTTKRTALIMARRAIKEGNLKAISKMLAKGLDPNIADDQTLLDYAVKQSFKLEGLEIVRLLLEAGADPNVADRNGQTPLHWVAVYNLVEMAGMLIGGGANPNAVDKRGRTPLHISANEGSIGTTRVLLEGGADPNVADENGQTPLHDSATYSYREGVKIIDLLLAANAEVNVADKNGITPLHIAARLTQPTKIIKLLEGGADPNAVDKDGRKPVDEISIYSYSRQEMIKLLSI